MKIRLLFLIGIEFLTMFPRTGLQHITKAANQSLEFRYLINVSDVANSGITSEIVQAKSNSTITKLKSSNFRNYNNLIEPVYQKVNKYFLINSINLFNNMN